MDAYHVQAGESRLGPFSLEELAEKVGSGELALSDLVRESENAGWVSIADLLAAEGATVEIVQEETGESQEVADSDDDAEEVVEETLLDGPGFVVTPEHLVLGEEIFSWGVLNKAEVEIEHTRRGPALAGTVVFGVVGLIVLLLPLFHDPGAVALWVIWGVVVAACLVLFCRNATTAFRSAGTFLAVHLADGDDRIVPLTPHKARQACDLINERIGQSRAEEQ